MRLSTVSRKKIRNFKRTLQSQVNTQTLLWTDNLMNPNKRLYEYIETLESELKQTKVDLQLYKVNFLDPLKQDLNGLEKLIEQKDTRSRSYRRKYKKYYSRDLTSNQNIKTEQYGIDSQTFDFDTRVENQKCQMMPSRNMREQYYGLSDNHNRKSMHKKHTQSQANLIIPHQTSIHQLKGHVKVKKQARRRKKSRVHTQPNEDFYYN
ncbi:unnamed protein product [Moneuplotes crassus]|uniref:Uncharacterized protein n=1 Tax=Euplotes crassus TaxID=5936 RepID=A0AAD1UH53_EUPCR|nr:unnamed protein product [Moneuplotes crassus]